MLNNAYGVVIGPLLPVGSAIWDIIGRSGFPDLWLCAFP